MVIYIFHKQTTHFTTSESEFQRFHFQTLLKMSTHLQYFSNLGCLGFFFFLAEVNPKLCPSVKSMLAVHNRHIDYQ